MAVSASEFPVCADNLSAGIAKVVDAGKTNVSVVAITAEELGVAVDTAGAADQSMPTFEDLYTVNRSHPSGERADTDARTGVAANATTDAHA